MKSSETELLTASLVKDILVEQGYSVIKLGEPCETMDACDAYLYRHICSKTLGHIPIAKIRDYLSTSFPELDIVNSKIDGAESFKIIANGKVVAVGLLGNFATNPEIKVKTKGWLILLGDDIASETKPIEFCFIPAPVNVQAKRHPMNEHHLPYRKFC